MSPLRRGRGSSEDAVELGAMGGAVMGGGVRWERWEGVSWGEVSWEGVS